MPAVPALMEPTALEVLLAPAHRALLAALVAAGADLRLALVGGALRDLLLHRLHRDPRRGITDLDVVVEPRSGADGSGIDAQHPSAHQLAQRLLAQLDPALVVTCCFHGAYGTVELELKPAGSADPDGSEAALLLDLATARAEVYPAPAENPQVRFAPLEADLARRDFTVNAMALLLEPDGSTVLLDPHGGLADLQARQLRLLHPDSLRDDPTRLLRAARYAARLGFRLEASGLDQAQRTLASWPWPWRPGDPSGQAPPALGTRLRMELELLLDREPWPQALDLLQRWGGLQLLDAGLQADTGWLRRMRWGDRAGLPRIVTLFAGAADPLALAERLQIPHREQRLLRAWRHLQTGLEGLDPEACLAWSPSIWTDWLEQWPQAVEAVPLALAVGAVPRRPLLAWWLRWRFLDAGVQARDLLAQGFTPGPALGQRLRELRRQRIDQSSARASHGRSWRSAR